MMRINFKKSWPLAAPIIAPLILFSELLISGKALFWGTPILQFFPWWKYAWETVLSGKIPYMNPLVGMGAPLVANYQSAVFYPPYWIDLVVYAVGGITWMVWAHTWIVAGHLAWAGVGSALLAKELGLKEISQSIAGLCFGLGGYLVSRAGFFSINSAAAWFPWVLLLTYRLVHKAKWNSAVKLSLVFGFLFLAGHAQTAWYILLFSIIWLFFWIWNSNNPRSGGNFLAPIGKYIVAGMGGAGLAALQLLPTAEYLSLSQRAGQYGFQQAMTYSFWPWRFITLAVPGFFGKPNTANYWGYGNYWEDALYIGLLPLILVLILIVKNLMTEKIEGSNTSRKVIIFFTVMTTISLILALGDNLPVFPFLYRYIPTFDMFQAPARFNIWAQLSLAIMAGYAVDQWNKPEKKNLYWTRLAAAGSFAVVLGAGSAYLINPQIEITFIPATALAGIWGLFAALLALSAPDSNKQTADKWWISLVVLIVAGDLISAGWGLNPGIERKYYEAQEKRVSETDRYFIAQDLENDLKYKKFFRFESFAPEGDWGELQTILLPNYQMIAGISSANNFDPIVPERYANWMTRLNQVDDNFKDEVLALMGVTNYLDEIPEGAVAYRSIEVSGNRLFAFYPCAAITGKPEGVLESVFSGKYNLSKVIFLESENEAPEKETCEKVDHQIDLVARFGNYLRFNLIVEKPGWVLIRQTWYPGWKATVDGEAAEIIRADYLFQAVYVEGGSHLLELEYKSRIAAIGRAISAASILIIIYFLIAKRKS